MIIAINRYRQGVNLDYYLNHHVPLSEKVMVPLGVTRSQVIRFLPGPDGQPPDYEIMTALYFPSLEVFNAIRQNPAVNELFADTSNYYTGEWPEIFVGEVLHDKVYEEDRQE